MDYEAQIRSVRRLAARNVLRVGRAIDEPDDPLEPAAPVVGPESGDKRAVLTTSISVVISHHAIERYGERTGREMGRARQLEDLRNVWPHAVISSEPPQWHKPTRKDEPGTLYASICDLLIPLAPYEGRDNTYVAKTVLSKVGNRGAVRSSGKLKKRLRPANKTKRRKPGERGRPRVEEPPAEVFELD